MNFFTASRFKRCRKFFSFSFSYGILMVAFNFLLQEDLSCTSAKLLGIKRILFCFKCND